MKKTFALLITTIILLSACQKTPEELIVQNKADDELMKAVNEQANENPGETPEPTEQDEGSGTMSRAAAYKTVDHVTFTEELSNGFEVNADADINVFDTQNMPIISYRRKEFTQEFVENAFNVLLGDKPFYEIPNGSVMSKSQIEERIVEIKFDYEDLKSPMAIAKGITDIEYLHSLRDEVLAYLYHALETAPDTVPLTEKGHQLTDGYTYGKTPFNDAQMLEFRITNNEHGKAVGSNDSIGIRLSLIGKDGMNTLWTKLQSYRRNGEIQADIMLPENAVSPVYHQPETMTMTPEQAAQTAEDVFRRLGAGDDVMVSNIYYIEITEDEYTEAVSCYGVELKRYVGSMPIEIEFSTDKGKEKRTDDFSDQFNSGVPMEEMTVFISDEGIIDLEWREPIEPVEMLNQNVELVSAEEIIDVFRQEFKNAYSLYDAPENGDKKVYNLDEIRLNYGIARIPNQNDAYMAIPLWEFYAYYFETARGDSQETRNITLLTINALDKSRFSHPWGY